MSGSPTYLHRLRGFKLAYVSYRFIGLARISDLLAFNATRSSIKLIVPAVGYIIAESCARVDLRRSRIRPQDPMSRRA